MKENVIVVAAKLPKLEISQNLYKFNSAASQKVYATLLETHLRFVCHVIYQHELHTIEM
jgi:hypothetical protein